MSGYLPTSLGYQNVRRGMRFGGRAYVSTDQRMSLLATPTQQEFRRRATPVLRSVARTSSRNRRRCFLASGERALFVLAGAQAELGRDRRAEATAIIAITVIPG